MLWLAYVLIFLYGLAHTPLLVDILRQLFPQWNVKRVTSSVASFILILLILFVFFLSLGVQVVVFIPLVAAHPLHLILHCLFAYWVWGNAFVNYVYTVLSTPGIFTPWRDNKKGVYLGPSDSRCKSNSTEMVNSSESLDKHDCLKESSMNEAPNSHSCKICGCVILYRDHHCPFTGNCIGIHNYSYFFLSLLYAMVGLGYEVVVFFVYFSECSFLVWKAIYTVESDQVKGVCKELESYGESVLPTIGAFVTVSAILSLQVFMLFADISTYQLLKQWKKVKIDPRKPLKKNSRFRIMLLNQRSRRIYFLLPFRNMTQTRISY